MLATLAIVNEALDNLKNSYKEAKVLNEEITELLEQISVIETLPQCLSICQVKRWRPSLLTKLRMKFSECIDEYNTIIVNIKSGIDIIHNYGLPPNNTAASFSLDLRCVCNFFLKVFLITSKNQMSYSKIMLGIPELPFNIEQALDRLTNDLRVVVKS